MLEEQINLFVPLTNDLLFKETFGKKENNRFLEYLLEVYYNYPGGSLKNKLEVKYESLVDKTRYYDKGFRNDLQVIINNEIFCNIEMYETFNVESFQKSKSYIMRIYSTQLDIGDPYNKIKKVTQINFASSITEDIKVTIDEEIKNSLYMGNKEISNDISMDIVRIDLARKVSYNKDDKFITLLNFISAKTKEEREEISKGSVILMEMNKWIDNYMTDDEWWRTYNDAYWNKRIERHEGARESKMEIAKKMLAKGKPEEEILEFTGLTIKQLADIKEEL